jgi:hypothetical protein
MCHEDTWLPKGQLPREIGIRYPMYTLNESSAQDGRPYTTPARSFAD